MKNRKNKDKKNKKSKNEKEVFEDVLGLQDPSLSCPDSYCNGRDDGNYAHPDASRSSYFVQCSGGMASCQACWPLSLVFSETCNQCLYDINGRCLFLCLSQQFLWNIPTTKDITTLHD